MKVYAVPIWFLATGVLVAIGCEVVRPAVTWSLAYMAVVTTFAGAGVAEFVQSCIEKRL